LCQRRDDENTAAVPTPSMWFVDAIAGFGPRADRSLVLVRNSSAGKDYSARRIARARRGRGSGRRAHGALARIWHEARAHNHDKGVSGVRARPPARPMGRESRDEGAGKPSPEDLEELSPEKLLEKLETDPKNGLDEKEVESRLERHGENAMEEERSHPLLELASHFWGPIPWMLEIAAVLSVVAQRWEEFAVILVMLLINGGVGFWHEHKAQNAIEALKQQLAPKARVVRDGEKETIASRRLVPGDVVVLRTGDVVPADLKLLDDEELSVDESALTGESLPAEKRGGEPCFSGTTVKRGEARGVVIATGANTRFARTIELVESAEESSHFQQAVLRIGYFLIAATAALVIVIVAVGWWRADPWIDLLMFALVLTIAGIPQALPAVLTVTMAVGAHRIAQMKAVVSRLAAMEELAGMHVLCADKTGTLTENQLELQEPVLFGADEEEELLRAGALTARGDDGDPIDEAILRAVDENELDDFEVVDFHPFDAQRKRAEADVRHDSEEFSVAKGAPRAILELVEADGELAERVKEKVAELGDDGFRALGVAQKKGDGWEFLGILPLLDPPREDAADVVEEAQNHGLDVRMITGDDAAIARQVAGQVGLGTDILAAPELFGDGEDDLEGEEAKKALEADGFAQVTPEHKFRLVRCFQSGDRIVGMTGDGVNDAAALKQAEVGVAVEDATDAARAASDLVLTGRGLGVIIHAVEEARRIFQRMVSYATFRITETLRVLLFIAISILAFELYPVTPIMIVLLAILNDIPIMTMATDNARAADHPVRWDMRGVLTTAAILGIGGVISSFVLFWYVRVELGLPFEAVQTVMFLKLLVAGHMTLFLCRNDGWLWERPFPSLTLFVALEGTQIAGTLVAVYGLLVHPIGWALALGVWGYAIVWLLLLNAVKVGAQAIISGGRGRTRAEEALSPA